MPPLIMDRPVWPQHPAVFIQRSENTVGQIEREFARILASTTPLNNLLSKLRGFRLIENYNGLTLRIEQAAHDKARRYLENAAEVIVYPVPELTPDGEGGIDIEWENAGKHLAINFSASGNGDFVSWREPNGRYEGAPATEGLLVEQLRWLMR